MAQAAAPKRLFLFRSLTLPRRPLDHIWVASLAGDRRRGLLVTGVTAFPCALGRAGPALGKREGDGATPVGTFRMAGAFYRADRLPRPDSALPLRALRPHDGWCDDPRSRFYNQWVTLPFPASHERLWRDDHLYDVVVVIDYNLDHPKADAGSAIFLHCAAPGFAPTAGCVAVTPAAMRRLLPRIGLETRLTISA
jgi:L,D-peptidoglycan transpeptidase YkuD (ErfK/YbiS/YcfS/YnhG family)